LNGKPVLLPFRWPESASDYQPAKPIFRKHALTGARYRQDNFTGQRLNLGRQVSNLSQLEEVFLEHIPKLF
jgi:hypothetical protein